MAEMIWVFVMARMGLSFDCLKSLQDDMPDSRETARKAVPVPELSREDLIFWHV